MTSDDHVSSGYGCREPPNPWWPGDLIVLDLSSKLVPTDAAISTCTVEFLFIFRTYRS